MNEGALPPAHCHPAGNARPSTGLLDGIVRASFLTRSKKAQPFGWTFLFGAGDEARTRYLHLGKVALYRMSYTRGTRLIIAEDVKMSRTFSVSPDSSYRNRRPKTAIADCRKKPRRVRCVSSEKDSIAHLQYKCNSIVFKKSVTHSEKSPRIVFADNNKRRERYEPLQTS